MSIRSPKELQKDIQKAVSILESFTNPNKAVDVQKLIPKSVLRDAHGIVIIRMVRYGAGLSIKSGTGIIIGRLPDGSWSAPSGVSISSVGLGYQLGGEVIESIIVMNYRAAVKAFYDGGGQLQFGLGVSIAAGPFGRAADISASASSMNYIAATYAYSVSKGLYFGYSFEGSKISERPNTNQAYYGRPITAREILTGYIPPPQDAARLYNLLLDLGAGPRPGLPFAPQKSVSLPPHMSTYQTSSLPPPPPQRPRPNIQHHINNDIDNDPPPPYELYNATNPLPQQQSEKQRVEDHYNHLLGIGSSSSNHQPNSNYQSNNNYQPNNNNNNNNNNINNDSNNNNNNFNQEYDTKNKDNQEIMSVVIAKFDFTASDPNDISFKAGDTIIVTKKLDNRNCWWEGEIGTKRGYFPANYTEDLTD